MKVFITLSYQRNKYVNQVVSNFKKLQEFPIFCSLFLAETLITTQFVVYKPQVCMGKLLYNYKLAKNCKCTELCDVRYLTVKNNLNSNISSQKLVAQICSVLNPQSIDNYITQVTQIQSNPWSSITSCLKFVIFIILVHNYLETIIVPSLTSLDNVYHIYEHF